MCQHEGMAWDPEQYIKFVAERERPFHELVARIDATEPGTVLDIGCGPGSATSTLLDRWPAATVVGVDSSVEMIAAAEELRRRTDVGGSLEFSVGDAHGVDVSRADVVISNAMLQWIPDHRDLLQGWAATMKRDSWLAFQVPGNFDAPSHRLMRETAADGAWAPALRGVLRGPESVDDAQGYATLLMEQGLTVDAWETTYIQWLTGQDPVLEWVKGTGLRPATTTLERDAPEQVEPFVRAYAARLRDAYPARLIDTADGQEHLTALPFRRIFVVAHKP